MRAYEASTDSFEVFALKIVSRKEETSAMVGGTPEEADDLVIMMGTVGGETECGILRRRCKNGVAKFRILRAQESGFQGCEDSRPKAADVQPRNRRISYEKGVERGVNVRYEGEPAALGKRLAGETREIEHVEVGLVRKNPFFQLLGSRLLGASAAKLLRALLQLRQTGQSITPSFRRHD